MKTILFFIFLFPTIAMAQFEGEWFASFKVMGQPMKMKVVVSTNPTVQTTLYDSKLPDYAMKCDSTNISDSSIYFILNQFGLSFEGTLNSKGIIEGNMSQGGLVWEANFHRTEQKDLVAIRPQTPKPPFTYKTEEVTLQNGEITLAGTLTIPNDFNEETPVVILASGTGPQDRDCNILEHKSFWVIADHLSENGIAVLRFDDRSKGSSTGEYFKATLYDFGSDVEAWARYLRKDKRFKKNPLGLAGHSEGGMHALLAATEYKKIDFIVQLAAVSTSGREVLIAQQYLSPKAAGESEEIALWNQSIFIGLCEILANESEADYKDSLRVFLGKKYDTAPTEFDKSKTSRIQFILPNMQLFANEWGRQFVTFDASEYLDKLKMPILAINGEEDVQVPAKTNAEGFRSYSNIEVHVIPGVNHLFQHCETCSTLEYGEIEETFAPEVLDIMTDWILKQR